MTDMIHVIDRTTGRDYMTGDLRELGKVIVKILGGADSADDVRERVDMVIEDPTLGRRWTIIEEPLGQ